MMQPQEPADLDDAAIDALQELLAAVPAPLEPLDISALDGFLCGVLLQHPAVPQAHWLTHVTDAEGRPAPAGTELTALHALVRRRHAALRAAIAARRWFDPWLFDDGEATDPTDAAAAAARPWVAGLDLAMQTFSTAPSGAGDARAEPLALLYQYLEADERPAGAALDEAIEAIEPPASLEEAAEDLVRAVLLLADLGQHGRREGRRPSPRPSRR